MIVVSIIGLLAAIAIPNFVHARTTSNQTTCINNLRQIGGAIAQWALEKNASATTTVQFTDIQPYLHGTLVCPAGGTSFSDSYTISDVQTPPPAKRSPPGRMPIVCRTPPNSPLRFQRPAAGASTPGLSSWSQGQLHYPPEYFSSS